MRRWICLAHLGDASEIASGDRVAPFPDAWADVPLITQSEPFINGSSVPIGHETRSETSSQPLPAIPWEMASVAAPQQRWLLEAWMLVCMSA